MNRAKLAAGGGFHQGARLCSGIGLHPKLDLIVVPVRAFPARCRNSVVKWAPSSLSGANRRSLRHRARRRLSCAPPTMPAPQIHSRIARPRPPALIAKALPPRRRGRQARPRIFRRAGASASTGNPIFASCGAQGQTAFLQPAPIRADRNRYRARRDRALARKVEGVQGGIERLGGGRNPIWAPESDAAGACAARRKD